MLYRVATWSGPYIYNVYTGPSCATVLTVMPNRPLSYRVPYTQYMVLYVYLHVHVHVPVLMCAVTIFSQTAVPLYSLSLSLSRDVKTASARNPQTSRLPQPRANSPKAKPNKDMADVARRAQDPVLVMDANELARRLHQSSGYFLLDCRPVLAFNSSHISGAVNINFTNMMKKRFLSGKIGLADLVTSEEGKEKFKVWPCSGNLSSPSPSLHICVPPSLSFSLLLFLLPPSLPPSLSPSPSSPALFLLPSFFSSIRIRVSLSHASILPSFFIYPTPLSPPSLTDGNRDARRRLAHGGVRRCDL